MKAPGLAAEECQCMLYGHWLRDGRSCSVVSITEFRPIYPVLRAFLGIASGNAEKNEFADAKNEICEHSGVRSYVCLEISRTCEASLQQAFQRNSSRRPWKRMIMRAPDQDHDNKSMYS